MTFSEYGTLPSEHRQTSPTCLASPGVETPHPSADYIYIPVFTPIFTHGRRFVTFYSPLSGEIRDTRCILYLYQVIKMVSKLHNGQQTTKSNKENAFLPPDLHKMSLFLNQVLASASV